MSNSTETDNVLKLKASASSDDKDPPLVRTLSVLDPILRFLMKATGLTTVPLSLVYRTLPSHTVPIDHLQRLVLYGIVMLEENGIVGGKGSNDLNPSERDDVSKRIHDPKELTWDNSAHWNIGFPSSDANLRPSTQTAAKRRVAALKRRLRGEQQQDKVASSTPYKRSACLLPSTAPVMDSLQNGAHAVVSPSPAKSDTKEMPNPPSQLEQEGWETIYRILGDPDIPHQTTSERDRIVYDLVYAGSQAGHDPEYAELSPTCRSIIPNDLIQLFALSTKSVAQIPTSTSPEQSSPRRLYCHQARAIEAIVCHEKHTAVCTGTGSGKSLCFWLPILTAVYNSHDNTLRSLVLFPTKALAQDQFTKLMDLLSKDTTFATTTLRERIRPAILDGDTPHSTRIQIAESANVILTNPDTVHATILPHANTMYAGVVQNLHSIVVDEAHCYEGAFGVHVALTLRRLHRVVVSGRRILYIATSATLPRPLEHFRRLFPLSCDEHVEVIQKDASPRSSKHFFIQNPPLVHMKDGSIQGRSATHSNSLVQSDSTPNHSKSEKKRTRSGLVDRRGGGTDSKPSKAKKRSWWGMDKNGLAALDESEQSLNVLGLHRRHAADETALFLARAVMRSIRCIAFCKTRNLVEWVYARTKAILDSNKCGHLIESYRGGYSMKDRRGIEQKLFSGQLIGVVATNALELGVDVGGVDLTLHCGYPSSHASLLQQAGRAGRGLNRMPSLAIMICFNSAAEQHVHRHPGCLLGSAGMESSVIPDAAPDFLQGHILCASGEVPLTGEYPVSALLEPRQYEDPISKHSLQSDWDLFGGKSNYELVTKNLISTGSLVTDEVVLGFERPVKACVYRMHKAVTNAWSRLSIRSIEPITYGIVDLSNHIQSGRMDGIYDETAVLDTIPYSRVFYHAHPGAIIFHRGQTYKIISMVSPPPFSPENYSSSRSSLRLAAFARPTHAKYRTRPLSNHTITVVRPVETVESQIESQNISDTNVESGIASALASTIGGCGNVLVKRTVHGYKKLSLITRQEISRSELTLPQMEYDTFGIWFDAGAESLMPHLQGSFGPGVHALSHAMLAVAPVVCQGVCRSDIQCDHSYFAPTNIMLFDNRPGGSGACQKLWREFFKPFSIIRAALSLLEGCSVCNSDPSYDGGCPECLHDSNCIKFNAHLSRSAAILIGKWLLDRVASTEKSRQNMISFKTECSTHDMCREEEVEKHYTLASAKVMPIVVARPSWPLDGDDMLGSHISG